MLSVSVGQNGAQAFINVAGTRRADVIVISQDALRASKVLISVNGVAAKYSIDRMPQLNITAGRGNDVITVGNTRRHFSFVGIDAGAGQDVVNTGAGFMIYIDGNAGDDHITSGSAFATSLNGGAGNDTLVSGTGQAVMDGGDGNDLLQGARGLANTFRGGAGNDTLLGSDVNDYLDGDDGDDSLVGLLGDDVIMGGAGNDYMQAGPGDNLLHGNDGNDTIDAGAGADYIDAGAGEDFVNAGPGSDSLYGGDGNDSLNGQDGNDFLLGDRDDILPSVDFNTGLTVYAHQPGNDRLDGGAGNDILLGSHESDTYAYDNGIDTMVGGGGNDVIDARGNDVIADLGSTDTVPVRAERTAPGVTIIRRTAYLSVARPDGLAVIPKGVGQFGANPRMYTSDDQGTLELRDTGGTPFTLEEFFRIWGYRTDAPPIAGTSPYYIWVDGVPTDARNVQIHGGDHIAVVLAYPYYI